MDITIMLLKSEKFRSMMVRMKIKLVWTVENFDRGDKEMLLRNNYYRGKPRWSSKPRVDYSNKECFYCHRKGHVQFYNTRLTSDLEELMTEKKSCEEHKEVASCELMRMEKKSFYVHIFFINVSVLVFLGFAQ